MTWIKICGITNLEDAQLAVDAGADALGFVFYEKSPRRVDVETAKAIVEQLPEKVEKVGVFVGQSVEDMHRIVEQAGLTAAQVHGESSRELLEDPCSIDQQIGIEKVIAVLPGDAVDERVLHHLDGGKEKALCGTVRLMFRSSSRRNGRCI